MKNLILPAFVMLIGAGTAFASETAEKSSKLLLEPGYLFNPITGECGAESTTCETIGSSVCTVDNIPFNSQVKGKREVDGVTICDVILYQPQRP